LAEWLDYDLITNTASVMPDWTFEFIGPVRYAPTGMTAAKNIRLLEAVDYAQLPQSIRHWTAAWIPFQNNKLTHAVNPLKLREYLAAGLPTLSTPLPEVLSMTPWVDIIDTPAQAKKRLESILENDSSELREKRRKHVESDSWRNRSAQLRQALL
jgi:hypothetical protein